MRVEQQPQSGSPVRQIGRPTSVSLPSERRCKILGEFVEVVVDHHAATPDPELANVSRRQGNEASRWLACSRDHYLLAGLGPVDQAREMGLCLVNVDL